MNREDIIQITTESWLTEYGRTLLLRGDDVEINIEELERFAARVAAEKEKRIIDILERLHERCRESHNYYKHAIRVIKGEI